MRLWIDLANSPHVLFFAPIVERMRLRGIDVAITARDFAQTVALARLHGLKVEAIGRHGGRSTVGKARAIVSRAFALRRHAHRLRPDLAVSHNSYAHCLAARSLGIPYVTIMDYEHTPANHVNFRLASRVLLPKAIPLSAVRKYGATARKVVFYDGFKEQVYLDGFEPDRSKLAPALPDELWDRYVVVVARPPADFAIYHRFENPLFETWLRQAASAPSARIVVLPRTPEQRASLLAMNLGSVIIPAHPLDGANLVYHADLVVSAGGTMNREAAVLGVPAYSIFAGRTAAVDRELQRLGRLVFIRQEADLEQIRLAKRAPAIPLCNPTLPGQILDLILSGLVTAS